jgi:hypothetical protein
VTFVRHLEAVRVEKDGLGFRERDAVLPLVASCLASVPVVEAHGADDGDGPSTAAYVAVDALPSANPIG